MALQVLLHSVGRKAGVAGDRNGELDAVVVAEAVEPIQEVVRRLIAVAADDLEEVVDEDVGNIVIAGIQTADEAAQALVSGDLIFVGRNETNVIMDVEGHRGLGLDAHHIAVFLGSRGVDKLDELFGLAGALFTHDKSDHKKSLLCITSVP